MDPSIFWYDFETTGIFPRADRPLQVAGIRTDFELNEVEEPINFYCQLSDDILPHPQACLVTGITPQILEEKGLPEADFFTRLHEQLARPQTCTAGYNSIRFDDEVARYGFYRNFFDPYAREWQAGNSRWDIIDLLRTTYALRPEGINWPEVDGQVSLRLELLTKQNGIAHEQAHDALSDVRATIALAKLVKEKQPKLYDYLFNLRFKREAQSKITLLKPLVHVSGRFAAKQHYLSIMLPLAWHPVNRNAVIACNLQQDIRPLLELNAEQIVQYLYTRHDDLPEDIAPIPLKLIHINRCPVLAPLNVLRAPDIERLTINVEQCLANAELLKANQALWQNKLADIYKENEGAFDTIIDDPEQQLYAGFLNERDRRLCEHVRRTKPSALAQEQIHFEAERLNELLFRYRARNYPATLNKEEVEKWQQFCGQRLTTISYGAPNTLEAFNADFQAVFPECTIEQQQLLQKWMDYIQRLQQKYNMY